MSHFQSVLNYFKPPEMRKNRLYFISHIMRSNSQRLPVTQHRLHSTVIVSLVINYHTLSSDAANLAVLFRFIE